MALIHLHVQERQEEERGGPAALRFCYEGEARLPLACG